MSFIETVRRAREFLRDEGRISLRGLKREFNLDDEALDELVEELVDVQQVAAREGKVVSWIGPAGGEPETRPVAVPTTPEPEPAAEAERRQLTVLFCDLVDSTRLAAGLDPEDWREVMRGYQEAATQVIERLDGHVAQYLGDGLLVYFGWPRAHEDDAERGVRAGLGIVEAVTAGNDALDAKHGLRLAVRIGIHTGPVVVGEMGSGEHRETLALGDTTNLAARLQGVAETDTVVVSAATLRLVRGIFITGDRGSYMLKGFAEPVAVHRIVRPSGVRSRLDLAAGKLTPFVGREQEVDLLLSRWEQVQEGHGQVVLVDGDAGIGKSRLVQLLHARLAEERHSWLECCSSRYHRSSAFRPIIELLEEALRFSPEDAPEARVALLEAALGRAVFDASQTLPLLATLLSLPLPDRYSPLFLSPEAQRHQTLELLANWLFSLTEQQAMVLVIEDLQWADPSTLELLGRLVEQVPTVPLLLVLSARPEFTAPWGTRSHLLHLTLSPLTRPQMTTMVDAIAGERALPGTVVKEVVTRSDGVPLFVEELTKSALESDRLEGLEIPATLQDALMARLDRLGAAKEVAQLASVLGREFPHALLAAVSPLEAPGLEAAIRRLLEAEILYQRGAPPSATYHFKHALIEDAAYRSLLRSARQRHHERVVRILQEHFPGRVASEPELAAHHCAEAGLVAEAITYFQQAGEAAYARSAQVEAVTHLTSALDLLDGLPESAERDQREATLQLALGASLIAAKGYSHEDVERAYGRARELSRSLGDEPQLFQAVHGLRALHTTRGELQSARELAEQALRLAQQSGEPAQLLNAFIGAGSVLNFLGEWAGSVDHFEQAVELCDASGHGSLWESKTSRRHPLDPRVGSRAFLPTSLWVLGYPERALARCRELVEAGRESDHPFSLAFAVFWVGLFHLARGERKPTRAWAEEAIAISEQQRFPLFLQIGRILRGWALAASPRGERGLEELRQGLAELAGEGASGLGSFALWMLADASRRVGRLDDALGALNAAFALSQQKHSVFWDAEIHRLKGDILLERHPAVQEEAEACFRRALEVAREQQARSFELRAATSLARLWQRQGKCTEARELLQPVYDWFTEGFDTPDLKDAKALLEELGS